MSSVLGAVALPRTAGELREGQLIFTARPSRLQSWAERFGHPWRHAGVIIKTDEGLRIATYGPKTGFVIENPRDMLFRYDRIGVATVFTSDAELARLDAYWRRIEALDASARPYVLSAPIIGPIHWTARKRHRGVLKVLLNLIVFLYRLVQGRRYRDKEAFVCSTFVWSAVHAARSTPLCIPLSAHPDDRVAFAAPVQQRDVDLARWVCSPFDLWNAVSPAHRYDLDIDRYYEGEQRRDQPDRAQSNATVHGLDVGPAAAVAPAA